MRHLFVALLGLALAGCISPNQGRPLNFGEFPSAEYQALAVHGNGRIDGRAFLKTRAGTLKPAAGKDVALIPATRYMAPLYKAYQERRPLGPGEDLHPHGARRRRGPLQLRPGAGGALLPELRSDLGNHRRQRPDHGGRHRHGAADSARGRGSPGRADALSRRRGVPGRRAKWVQWAVAIAH